MNEFYILFFFNSRSIHEVDNISLDNSSFVKCSPVCNNLADAFLKKPLTSKVYFLCYKRKTDTVTFRNCCKLRKLKKSSFFDVMCERSGTKLTEKKKENMNNVCV